MKPKHCDIEATLHGGELEVAFVCVGPFDGCTRKFCEIPTRRVPCSLYDGNECRSRPARRAALEKMKREVTNLLKSMQTEEEVEA